jgi:TetR/AcrR family transcriptional repressor of nem operon
VNPDTREAILTIARSTAQARGYGGLSFRELAKAVGIKSASIHYHFPTKGDLGAALARRYVDDARDTLESLSAGSPDVGSCLRGYTDIFRRALADGNRMCMCGFMAAEYDELPKAVRGEVQAFADANVAWLAKILSAVDPAAEARALAIFAAISGAQLLARSRSDISVYDLAIQSYRALGLIPD